MSILSMNSLSGVRTGLYRHFKGNYYFVLDVALDCITNRKVVYYVNACKPENGTYIIDLEDFCASGVNERKDNVTGQYYKFERVEDLHSEISMISTPQLINELATRQDSPLFGADLVGSKTKGVQHEEETTIV